MLPAFAVFIFTSLHYSRFQGGCKGPKGAKPGHFFKKFLFSDRFVSAYIIANFNMFATCHTLSFAIIPYQFFEHLSMLYSPCMVQCKSGLPNFAVFKVSERFYTLSNVNSRPERINAQRCHFTDYLHNHLYYAFIFVAERFFRSSGENSRSACKTLRRANFELIFASHLSAKIPQPFS